MLCNPLAATWFVFLAMTATLERAHLHRIVVASENVAIGMTEMQVAKLLGQPTDTYPARAGLALLLMGSRPRQWCYGTTINLKYAVVPGCPFANPLPINLRISEYDQDDLVIDWSPDNRVTRLVRPDFDVPEMATKMAELIHTIGEITTFAKQRPFD